MIYLFAAIICSSLIPNIFRYGQYKKVNQPAVITANYLVATIVNLAIILFSNPIDGFKQLGVDKEITQSFIFAIGLGIVTGCIFYFGFFFYQKAVHKSGVALSSAFGKMGVLIPIILSIVIWNEVPKVIQLAGILLALVAVVVMAFDKKSISFKNISVYLIAFFITGGVGEFLNKVFSEYGMTEHKAYFVFTIFLVALIISLFKLKKTKITKNDALVGGVVGVFNVLNSYFLILALYVLDGPVVFSMFSGGTIILASLLSSVFFKEKLKKKEYFAILLIIGAVIAINLT